MVDRPAPSDTVYLAPDSRAEPLVNGFRAWPHLVAPHTLSYNLRTKHLPLLRALAGTAKLPDSTRAQVTELCTRIERDRPELVRLADDIDDLNDILLAEADGYGLSAIYRKVPERLRGCVELVYDRNNQAAVRFLEPALYRSMLYDSTLQGLRLTIVDPDANDEQIGVPRLATPDSLVRPLPFADPQWDVLGRSRRQATPVTDIAAALGVGVEELRPLVTAEAPQPVQVAALMGVRVRFFGHACVLVESPDTTVLVDPLVAHRDRGCSDRYSFVDLPERIDVAAITHAHLDHLDVETLLQIRHLVRRVVVPRAGAGNLLDPSPKLVLQAIGFDDVAELDDFESLPLSGGRLTALPFFGEHGDLAIRAKAGYGVSLDGRTAVFVADSQCIEPRVYTMARELLGKVDTLFLGMECEGSPMTVASGPYLPRALYTDEMGETRRTRGSNAEEGLELQQSLGAGRVYIYAMGLEPWLAYMFGVSDPTKSYSLAQARWFIEQCRRNGVPAQLLSGPSCFDI
jgi:L-ascorbate metabolism protein UlaG (beta-lactamase superfamily)